MGVTLAYYEFPIWEQALGFGVLSLILVAFLPRLAKKITQAESPDNPPIGLNRLIGKQGIVTQDIKSSSGGYIKVLHEEWRAMSTEDIEEGQSVEVLSVEGNHLQVKRSPQ